MNHSKVSRRLKDVEITNPCNRGEVLAALKVLKHSVERLESLALGGEVRKMFSAGEIAMQLVELAGKMRAANGDIDAERTLSRVVFVTDAAYYTRTLKQLQERHRRDYEEEVKGLLRGELEDEEGALATGSLICTRAHLR